MSEMIAAHSWVAMRSGLHVFAVATFGRRHRIEQLRADHGREERAHAHGQAGEGVGEFVVTTPGRAGGGRRVPTLPPVLGDHRADESRDAQDGHVDPAHGG